MVNYSVPSLAWFLGSFTTCMGHVLVRFMIFLESRHAAHPEHMLVRAVYWVPTVAHDDVRVPIYGHYYSVYKTDLEA